MNADRFDETPDDTALDREIRALLAVEPSPHFHASARRRIANASVSADRRRHPWWLGAVATAAVLTALVVVAPSQRPAPRPALAARRVAVFSPAIAQAMRRMSPEIAPASGRMSSAKRDLAQTFNPAILLAPDETRALRALIAGVREGRIDLTPVTRAATPDVMDLEPIHNLAIAPIVIAPVEGERQ